MLGALSSKEYQDLIAKKKPQDSCQERAEVAAVEPDCLDEGEVLWDPELGEINKEKQGLFSILSQFVPQADIFFNHHNASRELQRKKEAAMAH